MKNTTTYLYKAYSQTNELCYVGITSNLDIRFRNHRCVKPWWEVEVSYIKLESYNTRADAEKAEAMSIAQESPKYNEKAGNASSDIDSKDYFEAKVKTRSRLPDHEIEYLKSLNEPDVYTRAAELQMAGWSVTSILEGVKVSPTAVQLRTELKYIRKPNTGVDIPKPPLTRYEARAVKKANQPHMTLNDKVRLKHLSGFVKKYRPSHGPSSPYYIAREEYNDTIKKLYADGVKVSEIAEAVGTDESNIRRRLKM